MTSFYSRKLYHVHIECHDNVTIRLFGSSWRKFVQDNLSVEVCVLHFIQEDVTRFYVTGYKKSGLEFRTCLIVGNIAPRCLVIGDINATQYLVYHSHRFRFYSIFV